MWVYPGTIPMVATKKPLAKVWAGDSAVLAGARENPASR